MDTDIHRCRLGESPDLLRALDQEFVYSRSRTHSLAVRLPELFAPESLPSTYVLREAGATRAAATARRFRWVTNSRTWRGAMIGLVYTSPEFRGRGLGARVLRALQEDLRREGIDFGVLWTTIPAFYERLGWVAGDRATFGEVPTRVDSAPAQGVQSRPLTIADTDWVESVRQRWAPERVDRSSVSYRALPLPSTVLDGYLLKGRQTEGYALVGRLNQTGYLYEFVGDPQTLQPLWDVVSAAYAKLYVNELAGGPLTVWLESQGLVCLARQSLAMWLPLSAESKDIQPGEWHIPFFDRI